MPVNMLSISDTTTLFIHHTFLYIPLPLLHDYDVKVPYWSRFLEDVNRGKRLPFSFPEFSIQCLRIHAPLEKLPTFVRIERDGISATNWLKTGGFFSLQSVFGWSRAHFSWMGGVSLRKVLTPQHRTEIRINTAQKNIRKRKTGLESPNNF